MPRFFGSNAEQEENASDESNVSAVSNSPPAKSKKKQSGDLFALIDESVPETALLVFKEASSFAANIDGNQMFVGLLLPVDRIGGLDKKMSRKDPDRGQMLQCIKNDEIKVYATPDMLEQNCILFIPTQDTLNSMDEYSFLRQASYDLVAVDSLGGIRKLEKEISFTDAVRVSSGEAQISSFLGSTYASDANDNPYAPPIRTGGEVPIEDFDINGDDEQFIDDNVFSRPADDVPSDDDDDSDDEPDDDFDENPFGSDEPDVDVDFNDIPDSDEDEQDDEPDDDPVIDNTDYGDLEDDMEPEDEGTPVYEDDIEEDQVQAALSRRFYSDELGLEVSNEPFDAQFLYDNPTPAFAEDYDDQWLSGYLRQMARDGNRELARMHSNNIARLRENYFNLMARCCEDIQRTLDISSSDTLYGSKLHQLDAKKSEFLDKARDKVDKDRKRLTEEYEAKKKKYVDNAAATAAQQYENQYGRSHSAQLSQLEPAEYDRIESSYQDMRRNILNERRDKASKMLDYNISDIMKVLTEEYHKRLEGEEKRYEEIKASMQRFLDDNRKDEMARVQVLAEELERDNQVERVIAEYKARLDTQAEEHERKKKSLEHEMDELRKSNAAALRRKDEDAAQRVANADKKADELRVQLEDANRRYYELDEKKDREYAARMKQLRDDNVILADNMDNIVATHKRNNMISSYLVIVIVIAALAVGFIVGMCIKSSFSSGGSNAEIVEEYQRRLDELETKYGYHTPTGTSTQGVHVQ